MTALRMLFLVQAGLVLTTRIHASDASDKPEVNTRCGSQGDGATDKPAACIPARTALKHPEVTTDGASVKGSDSEPLILTPLIAAGKLDEAKSLSKVGRIGANFEVPSYAGYITVNPQFNSNLFFWFVPSLSNPKNDPVVLWLQGGPGSSSLLGFFVEHGPYRMSEDGSKVEFRNLTWAQRYSMLYVDQPVGSGFSFTDDDCGYARNMSDVARDMVEFLQQFFTLYGELSKNEFYMTGESYAGKYVPAIGAALHENAKSLRVKINFRGIAYGNGFTDPINMMDFGEMLHAFGLIDRIAADYMTRVSGQVADHIRAGHTRDAAMLADRLFFGLMHRDTYFKNQTGFNYYYNMLYDNAPADNVAYRALVQRADIRQALHVGWRKFDVSRSVVPNKFIDDLLRSARPQFAVVLEGGYRVLVYSGHLDFAMSTMATEKFLSQVSWSYADRWAREPRSVWRSTDGKSVYGYVKTVKNLNFVVVRNGGHMLPFDQPAVSMEMITSFIDVKPPFID
ncbi:venom serine carboxypeptidase-like [Amblyomma americanum]